MEEKIKELKEYISEINKLNEISNVLYWDMTTYMPEEGIDSRADALEFLAGEIFSKITSSKVLEFIDYFSDKTEALNTVNRAMVRNLERDYNKLMKIPKDRYKYFAKLSSKSEKAFEEAREKGDFNIFKPYLKEVIEYKKEYINYIGYQGNKYNALLDEYEMGTTVETLDKTFEELKIAIIDLLNKIKSSNKKIDNSFLKGEFSIDKQRELSKEIVENMGFDFKCGRLDESIHPYTIEFSSKDVRITTSYNEKELTFALYSSIHEGGHGIYEQNISDKLKDTGLMTGVSMGIHESQSRLYENILCRSEEFSEFLLKTCKKYFNSLKDVTVEEFYSGINKVMPSLIRTEADELTYSLHIIIRYEIEKAIFNDNLDIEDIKNLWNLKYKEYLGVVPENDNEGILQDMHWSDGSFGYFPSYALGNIYGAQILNKLKIEKPKILENLKQGDFKEINKFLKDNIHNHGALYKPQELLKLATKEDVNPKYYIDYLVEKYSKIYSL